MKGKNDLKLHYETLQIVRGSKILLIKILVLEENEIYAIIEGGRSFPELIEDPHMSRVQ